MVFPNDKTDLTTDIRDEDETVSAEAATIPASAPYVVSPEHPIKQPQTGLDPATIITIPGFTVVSTGSPQEDEFDVDFLNSRITFNFANAGQAIVMTYLTRGDEYVATIENSQNAAINRIEDNLGLNAEGSQPTVDDRLAAIESTNLINFVSNEIPSGTINGINAVFTLANAPIAGSDMVYRNGLRQTRGATEDYQVGGDQITFNAGSIPQIGNKLRVDYRYI